MKFLLHGTTSLNPNRADSISYPSKVNTLSTTHFTTCMAAKGDLKNWGLLCSCRHQVWNHSPIKVSGRPPLTSMGSGFHFGALLGRLLQGSGLSHLLPRTYIYRATGENSEVCWAWVSSICRCQAALYLILELRQSNVSVILLPGQVSDLDENVLAEAQSR